MEVVVSVPLCPLYASATAGAERVDELLCGWPAQLLEEHSTGWCRVRTAYRYEGWARREHFSAVPGWAGREKRLVRAPFADVLFGPQVERPVADTLPRGGAGGRRRGVRGWLAENIPPGRPGGIYEM